MAGRHAIRRLCLVVSLFITTTYVLSSPSLGTHQHFLGVADAPRQIADIAIGLHHLGRKLYAKPTLS
jgi:hypothetical protein